jgi:hypothetical protein
VSGVLFLNFAVVLLWNERIIKHSALSQNPYLSIPSIHNTNKSSFSTIKIVGLSIFCMHFPFTVQIQSNPENLVVTAVDD